MLKFPQITLRGPLYLNRTSHYTLSRFNSTKSDTSSIKVKLTDNQADEKGTIDSSSTISANRISRDDAQILLDRLFKTNKPSWSITSKDGSFSRQQAMSNIQEKNKFKVLDEKLLELQSQPVDFQYYLRNINDLKSANQLPYKFGSNQLVSEDPTMNHFLRQIVWEFNAPIRYAFGYGSKVFSQNVDASKSQVDMIFAVSYPGHWHSLNLHQYPQHYSFLRYFGSETISKIADWGAGVYFNPFVKMNFTKTQQTKADFQLKYGVTSVENLVDDLTNWTTMYLSGRLHKPVAIVRNAPKISLLEQFNLTSAVKLSLLLLNKPEINETELYEAITSISYLGDPRVKLGGENPYKVQNIVQGQFESFRKVYLPLIKSYFPTLLQQQTPSDAAEHVFKVNLSSEAKAAIISELPKNFRKKVLDKYTSKYQSEFSKDLVSQNVLGKLPLITRASLKPLKSHSELSFMELQEMTNDPGTRLSEVPLEDWEYIPTSNDYKIAEFVRKVADDDQLAYNLRLSIKQTVAGPALIQTMKGILTSGMIKSVKYAWGKKTKYWQGKASQ
ncbi:hypothetical protein FOA43_001815 [Brettanomyces nanus]|uniref:Phosphatidate cytidylyltransferase, mitochondrial n=1 Tax=Eeniella nana TaxID=13502 RepID=A0A875S2C7_EENNA|nr:uncharacterized protein FOA43_001815 [Brettanomyces nanus]QPG74485.1 hypothetical protein FOA43_001815 [Brettanomyces nanus]